MNILPHCDMVVGRISRISAVSNRWQEVTGCDRRGSRGSGWSVPCRHGPWAAQGSKVPSDFPHLWLSRCASVRSSWPSGRNDAVDLWGILGLDKATTTQPYPPYPPYSPAYLTHRGLGEVRIQLFESLQLSTSLPGGTKKHLDGDALSPVEWQLVGCYDWTQAQNVGATGWVHSALLIDLFLWLKRRARFAQTTQF